MRPVSERGSVLLFVLFVCLAVAVVVQTLAAVIVCSERCAVDESVGRQRMLEKEEGLRRIRDRAALTWESFGWEASAGTAAALEGKLDAIPEVTGWAMEAAVRQPSLSPVTLSARVERGRDGLDLPLAAVAAEEVVAPADRTAPWLVAGSEAGGACAYVVRPPVGVGVGPGCALLAPLQAWSLDEGWRDALALWGDEGSTGAESGGLAPGPGVILIGGEPGLTFTMPPSTRGSSPFDPVLVLVVGGGRLDLRDLGEVYGVVVVDGGSLLLDGTRVHGAVFATDAVDVGASGEVVYDQSVLRWATDRSMDRVRLVPGSRRESMD